MVMADISSLAAMRNYFNEGNTKSLAFRKQQLQKLKATIYAYENQLQQALHADLKKSAEESWITETGFVLAEIGNALKNLDDWMAPQKVSTNLFNLPSKSFIISEPLGITLIIAPWNYPFQLLFTPLVGAIAAGNCVMLKASEFTPATAQVMKEIVENTFDKNYIDFTAGDGSTTIPAMVNNFKFDHIFYTGSTAVGKIIYKMAAENLVPVTLELGGKSPCVVEADANIAVTAKRIALAKFSNCGQMCVTPDYVLVHQSKKDELVNEIKKTLLNFFDDKPEASNYYGKIINEKQFDRLSSLLQQGNILVGGQTNKEKLFIAPTLMDNVKMNSTIMSEEIFGPILPIITFNTFEEAKNIIALNPNPLAFYIFTSSKQKENEWLQAIPFGGGCVNNTVLHLTNHHLPFGGRGFSGTGAYHGKYSFDTFSHKKGILKTPTWFDPSIKYPPFAGKMKFFKMLFK
jgi:aldehyde dehydrogenase (NAD+)